MAGSGKRRGSGEGTIYQRKRDGRWEAKITLPDGRRKSHYADTQAEARRWLTSVQRDRDRGLPIARDERTTLAQYLGDWLETKRPTIRPGVWLRYERNVRLHLIPGLGRVRLAQLTTQAVQALYARLLAEGLAPGTVRTIHKNLNCALNEAVELGIVVQNVARRAKPPRPPSTERPIFTFAQCEHLLAAVAGHRLETLMVLELTTGMRQGELLGLRWADVNLDDAALYVRHNAQRIPGSGVVMFAPKTDRGRRRIELSAVACEALRGHRTRQLAERMAAAPGVWQDHDLVFCSGRGTPIRRQHLQDRFYDPLLRACGLPHIHFHDLRHTAATLMLESGVDILVVSQTLGHASVAVTLGLYGHVRPASRRQAAHAMDRLFGRAKQTAREGTDQG